MEICSDLVPHVRADSIPQSLTLREYLHHPCWIPTEIEMPILKTDFVPYHRESIGQGFGPPSVKPPM